MLVCLLGRGPYFLGGDEAANAANGLASCFLLLGDMFMFDDGENCGHNEIFEKGQVQLNASM